MANRNNGHASSNASDYGARGGDAAYGAPYGMGRGAQAPQPGPSAGYAQAGQAGYQPGQQAQQPQHANPAYGQQPYYGYGYGQQGAAQTGQQGYAGAQYAPQYAQYLAAQAAGYQAPATSQTAAETKRRRGPVFWIAIIVLILAVAAACFFALTMCDAGNSRRSGDLGQLEGKTADQIQAELDRQVEEGMFNISIASIVQFADGTSPGEIKIENVPGNRYLMEVSITLDDSGQEVYHSGVIEPNHHIQSDTLSTDLDAGTYPATAIFKALDPDTEAEIGEAAAQITIVVAS